MSDIDQLIKMANQIAENFQFHDDRAERTADHIRRFWAPQMRRKILAHIDAGGEGLSASALDALKRIEG